MGSFASYAVSTQEKVPKTYFPTSWLRQQSAPDPNPAAEENCLHGLGPENQMFVMTISTISMYWNRSISIFPTLRGGGNK